MQFSGQESTCINIPCMETTGTNCKQMFKIEHKKKKKKIYHFLFYTCLDYIFRCTNFLYKIYKIGACFFIHQ